MKDLNAFHDMLVSAYRTVGAEVTSPWFYTQLGLVLAASGIALGVATALRSRIDITSVAMGWPAPLRRLVRVLLRAPVPRCSPC
jgi:hypothetical protein